MAIQNVELYEFLRDKENQLFMEKDEVRACTLLSFYELGEFSKIVGSSTFDDGGIEVRMFEEHLAIDLNEIMEAEGEFLYEYRACFEEDDFERYEKALLIEFQEHS